MNQKISIKPRTGAFAGKIVFTNKDGYGIFTKNNDGTWLQYTGLMQTPKFKSPKHLSAWLRRNYYDTQSN